jgi:hypothetical protein
MNLIKKIDIYYVVTFLFLIISANGSFLSASDIYWFAVLIFMVLVGLEKKLITIKYLSTFLIFSVVYLIFICLRDVVVNGLEFGYLLSDAFFLVKLLFFSYVFCLVLKDKAAFYLVKVMVHLTILSLLLYSIQLVGAGDLIYKFSTSLNLQSNNTVPGYTNFVLFTFHKNFHDFANSGFSWEPGAFGCFLVLGLMLNLFLNKFIFERKSIILIIGIITTLATTDYLALIIVLFLAYRYRLPKINLGAVLLIAVFIGLVIFVPFLGSKIKDTYYEDISDLDRLKYLEIFYRHNQMQIPLNRFSSMIYIYNSFNYKLLLGVSNKYGDIVNKAFNINISNGLFDFLAKFGLVGLAYLVYKYSRLCIVYVVKAEYLIYCIAVLLVIGFGEPILVLPFVLMFLFLPPKQVNLVGGGMQNDEGEEKEKFISKYPELQKFARR